MSTEPLALDLANVDVRTNADLRRWLEGHGPLGTGDELALRLPEFQSMRSSLRDLLGASTGGGPFPAAALERVNEVSARVPVVLRLTAHRAVHEPLPGGVAALALARIAWSAIELLGRGSGDRVGRCDACGRFFLATRADRRWCSNACGNRMRVARHHARRRATSSQGARRGRYRSTGPQQPVC